MPQGNSSVGFEPLRKAAHRRRVRVALILLLGVLVACVAWLYANRDSVRFTPFESDAEDLLGEVMDHSRLPIMRKGDITRIKADGATPDVAKQSFIVARPPAEIRLALRNGCQQVGLDPADRLAMASDPDALCWATGRADRPRSASEYHAKRSVARA